MGWWEVVFSSHVILYQAHVKLQPNLRRTPSFHISKLVGTGQFSCRLSVQEVTEIVAIEGACVVSEAAQAIVEVAWSIDEI